MIYQPCFYRHLRSTNICEGNPATYWYKCSFPAAVGPPNEPAPTPGNGDGNTSSQLQVRISRMNLFFYSPTHEINLNYGKAKPFIPAIKAGQQH